ncbi:MAG: Crp/Fnr family transcriptional regulator [Chitinophagaceae bacterium]|jgi:CRP/FNR family transcriptional regulator|nr:Crp/Fnr family transcriptional regulator [Chitinophagaceae bacterium]
MQINLDILYTWGATTKKINKGDIIFKEDEEAKVFYQIISGCVRMFNLNAEGKEFSQGFFSDGESFGEPPLFINERYPATAQAIKETVLVKISKDRLFEIFKDNPNIETEMLILFATRIFYKSKTAKEISNKCPEYRIIGFLESYKKKKKINSQQLIPFTRQEIANFTSLRVETVIRTLTKMNTNKIIKIIDRKIYY